MFTIKQFTKYETGMAAALIAHYGREFSVSIEPGREPIVRRTNGMLGYDRRPSWQKKADIKACIEFINWAAA